MTPALLLVLAMTSAQVTLDVTTSVDLVTTQQVDDSLLKRLPAEPLALSFETTVGTAARLTLAGSLPFAPAPSALSAAPEPELSVAASLHARTVALAVRAWAESGPLQLFGAGAYGSEVTLTVSF